MTLIAERRWFAVAPDGEEFDLIIRLGQPYPATNASWACPLTLEGLHKKLPDIHGIDSLQAIELAMKLAADLVCSFAEKGGKIFGVGMVIKFLLLLLYLLLKPLSAIEIS